MCHYLGGYVQISLYDNVINRKGLLLLGYSTIPLHLCLDSHLLSIGPKELKLTTWNLVYMSAERNRFTTLKSSDWPQGYSAIENKSNSPEQYP